MNLSERRRLQTVTGSIDATEAALTLPHEHILVDFIGAAESGAHRYRSEDVVAAVRGRLEEIVVAGVRTFIDCTPMYLGRDVEILRCLSELTGLRIVTNTGQYKEPFLPESTMDGNADGLAAQWIAEFESGIDGTEIRPGFIKTAVNPEPLAPVQRTVIRAAAIASAETGLPIATHCGRADRAAEILDILESEGVDPEWWIFVHAQNEPDIGKLVSLADRGAWIELDGLRPESEQTHLSALRVLLDAGHAEKVLLSHDSGWYHVGEPGGGEIGGYTFLFDSFIPTMLAAGVGKTVVRTICSVNPGTAFAVRK